MGSLRIAIAFCLTAALCGCSPNVEDGVAAYRAGDYAKALAIFKQAPNNAGAFYHMHLMARDGSGIDADKKAASLFSGDWFERAAFRKSNSPVCRKRSSRTFSAC